MFPIAHGVVLDAVLDDLESEVSPGDYEERLRRLGRRIASCYPVPARELGARLGETITTLDNMGAVMELEEENGSLSDPKLTTCAYSCPLAIIPQ